MHLMTVTAVSSNTKTGPIPTISRPKATCPTTCPFLDNGCYGTGRIFGTTEKYAKPWTRDGIAAVLAKAKKGARYVRDRVVGDLLDPATGEIDYQYLEDVTAAATAHGLIPFGYTHVKGVDMARVPKDYVLNASCETVAGVEAALASGMEATIADDDIPEGMMIMGRRVVTCPAQTHKGVTCATCGLCAKRNRKAVVRFWLHGPGVAKARRAVAEACRALAAA